MLKRPTLEDIARAAGLSIMTVSRAIHQRPGVGNDLRKKILAIADKIGYHPNIIARGLATNHTKLSRHHFLEPRG